MKGAISRREIVRGTDQREMKKRGGRRRSGTPRKNRQTILPAEISSKRSIPEIVSFQDFLPIKSIFFQFDRTCRIFYERNPKWSWLDSNHEPLWIPIVVDGRTPVGPSDHSSTRSSPESLSGSVPRDSLGCALSLMTQSEKMCRTKLYILFVRTA